MKKVIFIGMIFISMLQAMGDDSPYESSPVMSIQGRALNGTTNFATVVNGYCSRAQLNEVETKIVKNGLRADLLKEYPHLKMTILGKILVYLNKEKGEVPKNAFAENYLLEKLDKLNPKPKEIDDDEQLETLGKGNNLFIQNYRVW